jgi:hypothetical protein
MNLKKLERYLRVNLLGPGPSSYKKIIYWATVSQRLGSSRLQILRVDSLVVCHWMVFLKTGPFMKWNNAEFTNVSSFNLLLVCSTHFTQSCRILVSLPTSKHFFKFVYPDIPGESSWWVVFRPPWCCFILWQLKIRTGLTLILDFWYPEPSYLVWGILLL